MLRFLQVIDDALIERVYQPITNFFFALFGITQFQLSKACIVITIAMLCPLSYLAIKEQDRPLAADALSMTLMLVSFGGLYFSIYLDELRAKRHMHTGARNPQRRDYFIRVACLIMFLYLISPLGTKEPVEHKKRALEFAAWLSWISTIYFSACDWPPPPKRKLVSQKESS